MSYQRVKCCDCGKEILTYNDLPFYEPINELCRKCQDKNINKCWDCLHKIGEECGIDGHEIYPNDIAKDCFED